MLLDQRRRIVPIAGLKRMLDRLAQEAVGRVPLTGCTVQRGHALRLGLVQPGLQEVAKEMVIAIPIALLVEGNHKQVRLFQLFENFLTARDLTQEWRRTRDHISAPGWRWTGETTAPAPIGG